MKSDVILNKVSIIERSLKRINDEYAKDPANLENFTKQDSIILNLQRACEASIDLGMHCVAEKKLGLPQSSRDAFTFLENEGIITPSLSISMKAMVGFRNVAVHDYQELSLVILQKIMDNHLGDFRKFTESILSY